jgi:hypothetical protein
MTTADWMHHATAFADTSFWAVARRLPAIVREGTRVGLGRRPARHRVTVG